MTSTTNASPTDEAVGTPTADVPTAAGPRRILSWLPLVFAGAAVFAFLVAAGTPVLDIARYVGYSVLTVILPGTLVFRALRRTPHTLVEDIALGAAVGLTLELAAWAVFSALDLRGLVMFWPVLVVVPFLAVPRLRRQWHVTGYTRVPLGWSWGLAGVVVFFTGYVYATFFLQNPILPTGEHTKQYIDLAYQLSLAGEAKHNFPLDLPQVAGEPLPYHWFAFVHLAMSSMVGHIDLPVVTMRLMIPAVCALTATLTAVAGWRVSGRRYVGIIAAALFLVIGGFNFTDPLAYLFGSQVEMIIWPSLSMTYSWALLVAILAVTGDVLRRRGTDTAVPALGWGAYPLAALLVFASSGAKASSLPVVLGGLAIAGVLTLVFGRKIHWPLVAMGAITAAGQLFATAVLFEFQTYGLAVDPLHNIELYWADPTGMRSGWGQFLVVTGTWLAFLLNMQLRLAGIIPLLWYQRGRLDTVQMFLLGSAITGPVLFYLMDDFNAVWFARSAFPFGLILSAWGYALVLERARLHRRGQIALATATAIFATALVVVSLRFTEPTPGQRWEFVQLVPLLRYAGVLAALALVVGVAWRLVGRTSPRLAGRGGAVLLTATLTAGAPGLLMDAKLNLNYPNGGGYGAWPVPRSRVEAARWVREHSEPTDIIATNVHCTEPTEPCVIANSFWLSGYSERSVLLEGWLFAPRLAGQTAPPFWDRPLLELNNLAIYRPTPERIAALRDQYRVRYLVVDTAVRPVDPRLDTLGTLATLRFTNSRMAVYELR